MFKVFLYDLENIVLYFYDLMRYSPEVSRDVAMKMK